jgi:hypothetical protein
MHSDCMLISCFFASKPGQSISMGLFSEQMSYVASTSLDNKPFEHSENAARWMTHDTTLLFAIFNRSLQTRTDSVPLQRYILKRGEAKREVFLPTQREVW